MPRDRPSRAGRTSTPPSPGPRPTTRLLGVRIAIGLRLDLGRPRRRCRRCRRAPQALAAADTPRGRPERRGLLVAGWLEASAGNLARAQADLDEALQIADELADPRLRADADRHRAFLSIQLGRPADVLDLATSSVTASQALGLSWETAAALVLSAYGSIMLGDTAHAGQDADEAIHLLDPLEDSWGLVHAEAMLGAIAQAEHRFGDAAELLPGGRRVADARVSRGQAALHRASLARVQRARRPAAGASDDQALEVAAPAATAGWPPHRPAQAGPATVVSADGDEAARGLRVENERWFGAAGGGDLALLTAACWPPPGARRPPSRRCWPPPGTAGT